MGGREGGGPAREGTDSPPNPPHHSPTCGTQEPPSGAGPGLHEVREFDGGAEPEGDTPTAGYVGGSTRWRVSVPLLHQRFLQPADLIGGFLAQGIACPMCLGLCPLTSTHMVSHFVIAGVEHNGNKYRNLRPG